MVRNAINIFVFFIASILICGCNVGGKKILDTNLQISNAGPFHVYGHNLDDQFSFDYKHSGFHIRDTVNNWNIRMSNRYFDVKIYYADENYAIFYCPISGIMNGLRIVPYRYSDLFLVSRKTGKGIIDIQSEHGLRNALLESGVIYIMCRDPECVRYYKIW